MHEATIRQDSGVMTLSAVFTVAPERQQEAVDLLREAANNLMRHQPGFVSASIHRNVDGRRIVNYAQWRSREEFEAMRKNLDVQSHMARVSTLAQFDLIVCEVTHVFKS